MVRGLERLFETDRVVAVLGQGLLSHGHDPENVVFVKRCSVSVLILCSDSRSIKILVMLNHCAYAHAPSKLYIH